MNRQNKTKNIKEVNVKVNSEWNDPTMTEHIIYSVIGLLIANAVGFDVSMLIYIGAYILTTYVLAPSLAQLIVKTLAESFIDDHIRPQPKEPSGQKEFELYRQRVIVTWVSHT